MTHLNSVHRPEALAAAAAIALLTAMPACLANDRPTFRSGLWKFERTLEADGKPTNRLPTSGLSIDREMTRCVDPTSALKAEFTPSHFGACKTRNVRKTGDGYVVQRTCDGAGPIETQIDVKNDSAYTEINQGSIGKIPTKETVVAQRVGDCERRRQ